MACPGTLIIVSAPSGAGKTSLVKALVQRVPDMLISISHTTRPRREGEVDGRDYHFISQPQFQSMLEDQLFVESAEVFGNYYGTSKQWVTDTLSLGIDVILEIDWQGSRQIRQQVPQALSIFILPPSEGVLQQRLQGRGQDAAEVIQLRMQQARGEISHHPEYDYLIVNDDFGVALRDLETIVRANRLKTMFQKDNLGSVLSGFL